MIKTIYLYINEKDIKELIDFFKKNNVEILNIDKQNVGEIPAIYKGITLFYLKNDIGTILEYQPSYISMNRLQLAWFRYENNDGSRTSMFGDLKKYIRKNYIISTDKCYYMGPHMYQEWKNKVYCFPTLVRYSKFAVEKEYIKEVFKEIHELEFEIKPNKVRLRHMDSIDFTEEAYVICGNQSEIFRTIFNKNTVIYEFGSECIFIFYNIRKKRYEFQLDYRIEEKKESRLVFLWERIREKFSVN